MSITSTRQLATTESKIQLLEDRIREIEATPGSLTHAERVSLGSLRRMMVQMQEEVIRYHSAQEANATSRPSPWNDPAGAEGLDP